MLKTSSPMGSTECKSKWVLKWLLTCVMLGFFIKLWWGNSWALRHMNGACSGLPKLMLAYGPQFSVRDPNMFWVPWIPTQLMFLRAGGLVACSHTKSPSDKTSQKLAATAHNNNVCYGSRSHKSHNTEILPISFPSSIEWNILAQAVILKACCILMEVGRSIPQCSAPAWARTRGTKAALSLCTYN